VIVIDWRREYALAKIEAVQWRALCRELTEAAEGSVLAEPSFRLRDALERAYAAGVEAGEVPS
jgi:hypothetical protein